MPLPGAELGPAGVQSGDVLASSEIVGTVFSVLFTGDGAGNLSTGWGISIINTPAKAQAVVDWFVSSAPAAGASFADLAAAWRAVFDGSPTSEDYDAFDKRSSTRLDVTIPDALGVALYAPVAEIVSVVIDDETPFDVTNGQPRSGFPILAGSITIASDADMANLDAQIATDLASTIFRIDNGWATNGLLAATGAAAVPVATGTAVVGMFDGQSAAGDERGGPAWWGSATDDYRKGLFLTVTGQGTYQIAATRLHDDGRIVECLLYARS